MSSHSSCSLWVRLDIADSAAIWLFVPLLNDSITAKLNRENQIVCSFLSDRKEVSRFLVKCVAVSVALVFKFLGLSHF